jgi:hypothetical protein
MSSLPFGVILESLAVVVLTIGVLRITRISEVKNPSSTLVSSGTGKRLKLHRLDRLGEGRRDGSRVS